MTRRDDFDPTYSYDDDDPGQKPMSWAEVFGLVAVVLILSTVVVFIYGGVPWE